LFISGWCGQISLSHSAFIGVGAYVAAISSIKYNLDFFLEVLLGISIYLIIFFIVAYFSARLKDDYFMLFSMGVQYIVYSFFNNAISITGGPLGITDIASLYVFGYEFTSYIEYFVFTLILCMIFIFYFKKIYDSPYGNMLKGINVDEIYMQSIGKDVRSAKIYVFLYSGIVAVVVGIVMAHYYSYIDPSSFVFDESFYLLSIVVVAGMNSIQRVVCSVVFFVLFPELLRFIGFSNDVAANIRQILFAVLLIAFTIYLNDEK